MGRIVVGLLLVLFGLAGFAQQFGLDFQAVDFWPLVVIVPGLMALLRGRLVPGLVVTATGVLLQLNQLHLLPPNWASYGWAALLIASGLIILWTPRAWTRWLSGRNVARAAGGPEGPGAAAHHRWRHSGEHWSQSSRTSEQLTDLVAIFSSHHQSVDALDFRGGEVVSLLGDASLDLLQAALAKTGAQLELTSLFGRIEVIVPPGTRVNLKPTPVFGTVHDRSDGNTGSGPVLDVQAVSVFGSIVIVN